jgi:hypothetical protein
MRIKVSDPRRLRQLRAFLAFDPDAQVTVLSDDELELWFLGSRNVWAQEMETELRLRLWLAMHPEVIAVLTP